MALVETVPEIVKVTTTMIPALQNIRLIRGLIIPLAGTGSMNEAKALEELQAEIDKQKKVRQKTRDQLNKRVIKIKDAMQCVENSLNANLILRFGKALMNVITTTRGAPSGVPDILYNEILECMKLKMLQQKNKRSRGLYKKTKPQPYSELVRLRKGKLHPFIPR